MFQTVRCSRLAGPLCCALLVAGACGKRSAEPSPSPQALPAASPPPTQAAAARAAERVHPDQAPLDPRFRGAPRLPEDRQAGERSLQQWLEHRKDEVREHALWRDREHLAQHRAVVELLKATRARYDGARTDKAVVALRASMPQRSATLEAKLHELDPAGMSPLLPEYEALQAGLADAYPKAKLAALAGDAAALERARQDFDQRLEHISQWLAAAQRSHGEGEGEGEGEEGEEHERHDRERYERSER